MGVDLGSRRIGVAVSDGSGTLASPLVVLDRSGDPAADRAALARLAAEEEVGVVVVGLPISLSGAVGPAAEAALAEAAALAGVIDVPVETWDERMTTVVADRALRTGRRRAPARRRVVDMVAAAVILQSWLDARGRPAPPSGTEGR